MWAIGLAPMTDPLILGPTSFYKSDLVDFRTDFIDYRIDLIDFTTDLIDFTTDLIEIETACAILTLITLHRKCLHACDACW